MVRLAVFDWNGTILADMQAVVEGMNQELKVIDHRPITVREYQEIYDTPTVNMWDKLGVSRKKFEANRMEMAKIFHAYYEPRVARARTRSGARKTLAALQKAGVTSIVLSNHTMEGIYFQVERLRLSDYFKDILANEGPGMNHYQGKQERLAEYMRTYRHLPEKTIIIGDTVEEVRIGRNLGLKTACVSGGYNSLARLRHANPDILVNHLPDILKEIKEL